MDPGIRGADARRFYFDHRSAGSGQAVAVEGKESHYGLQSRPPSQDGFVEDFGRVRRMDSRGLVGACEKVQRSAGSKPSSLIKTQAGELSPAFYIVILI